MAICSFSFLFPIFAVVVDFFFGCHCQHFLKPVHFFIIPFSSSSSSSSIACFRRRTFHEPNRGTSKLFRRAELIQTPIIIPVEFKSKGENAHFGQTGYKMPCNDLCL